MKASISDDENGSREKEDACPNVPTRFLSQTTDWKNQLDGPSLRYSKRQSETDGLYIQLRHKEEQPQLKEERLQREFLSYKSLRTMPQKFRQWCRIPLHEFEEVLKAVVDANLAGSARAKGKNEATIPFEAKRCLTFA